MRMSVLFILFMRRADAFCDVLKQHDVTCCLDWRNHGWGEPFAQVQIKTTEDCTEHDCGGFCIPLGPRKTQNCQIQFCLRITTEKYLRKIAQIFSVQLYGFYSIFWTKITRGQWPRKTTLLILASPHLISWKRLWYQQNRIIITNVNKWKIHVRIYVYMNMYTSNTGIQIWLG